jgi:hypothetical protein
MVFEGFLSNKTCKPDQKTYETNPPFKNLSLSPHFGFPKNISTLFDECCK